MDCLALMLRKAIEKDRIKDVILLNGAPRITHLFFADDVILLAMVDPKEAYELLSILNTFSLASAERINTKKIWANFWQGGSGFPKESIC